jgi:hypothetical protein
MLGKVGKKAMEQPHQRADELANRAMTDRATNVMTRVGKQHMRGKLEAISMVVQ